MARTLLTRTPDADGALMWALGGIVRSPEVPRVYIGSFIDEPWQHDGLAGLMDAEEADLCAPSP
jgi:hypothetical protein